MNAPRAESMARVLQDRYELLRELELADRIIRNGHGLAMSDVRANWSTFNWRSGIEGKDNGLMRFEEREALIKRVNGEPS